MIPLIDLCRVEPISFVVQLRQQLPAILNPIGRHVLEHPQCRDADVTAFRTADEKWIIGLAKRTTAVAFDATWQIAGNALADIEEGRQRISVSAMFGNDGAKVRLYRAGRFFESGQPDRSGPWVRAVTGLH